MLQIIQDCYNYTVICVILLCIFSNDFATKYTYLQYYDHSIVCGLCEDNIRTTSPIYLLNERELAVKRLKYKKIFLYITKDLYCAIRAKFTHNPIPMDLSYTRPVDEEDFLFEKIRKYVDVYF